MEELIKRISELEEKSRELDPSTEERREYSIEMNHFFDNFIATTETNKAYHGGDANNKDLGISSSKKTLTQLLATYKSEVVNKGINPSSERRRQK